MPLRVTMHILNEEPFIAEMEDVPNPAASYISFTNPRTREGKPVPWQSNGATGFLIPWSRVTFLEIMVRPEDAIEIEKFYRESR
jgi:hypothetical protein